MRYEQITRLEPIDKGWSGDKKYKVSTGSGEVYLLRLSPEEKYDRRLRQFRSMEAAAALGIPMCRPVEFGRCGEGVYSLQSWVFGRDGEEVIPTFPPAEQYAYGLEAGRILKQLHSIPAPPEAEDWESRFGRKLDRNIARYTDCPLKYDHGERFLAFVAANRHLLAGREQSYQHGDYHIGNMMVDEEGVLTVIDFDRDDWGDPWEEFNRIVWSAQAAPAFAAGTVDGYFGGQVPGEFWSLLALYICSNTLSSLPWAIPFGEGEITTMRAQAAEVLDWYGNMERTVPAWYKKPL